MTLNPENREQLERLALDLKSNSEDGWSFVETEGAVTLGFCRWAEEEEWDGDTEMMRSLWRPERLALIENGEAESNKEELLQWQKAHCSKLAANGDFTSSAFVVPLRVDSNIAGYALFTGNHGLPDVVLVLEGVFESVEAAKMKLSSEGAVGEV